MQHYRRAAAPAAPCTKNVRQAVALCLQIVYTWEQKAAQEKSRDVYADTSRDHHAGNIGCAVCAGRGLDLQTGRLEGRGLQRQLRFLPQPLRGPERQEEITQTGLLHETQCSSPVLSRYCCGKMIIICAPETSVDVSGALFAVIRSERTALGGVDGDGAQKILQRLLVGGAADVQLL